MASSQKEDLYTVSALSSAVAQYGNPIALSPRARRLIGQIVAANVNAATTIAATIEHSADKTNWYTYLSFTNIVGAAANQEIKYPTDDPVLPYVRSKVTLTGVTKLADVAIKLYFENFT